MNKGDMQTVSIKSLPSNSYIAKVEVTSDDLDTMELFL